MKFAINGRNLPSVRSYAMAVKAWDEAYQHNRFGAWRGLNNLRDEAKLVIKEGDRIRFRFHNTDLVTWFPDKIQVVCWDSISSAIFADRFLPHGLCASTRKESMYIMQGGRYFQSGSVPATFNLVNDKWIVDESSLATHTKYVLDKKKAAAVRKVLKPLRERRDMLLRLRGGSNRADHSNESYLCRELDLILKMGEVPDRAHKDLAEVVEFYDDDILLRNAYLIGGAVNKVVINDEVRPENVYAGRPGLRYLSNL